MSELLAIEEEPARICMCGRKPRVPARFPLGVRQAGFPPSYPPGLPAVSRGPMAHCILLIAALCFLRRMVLLSLAHEYSSLVNLERYTGVFSTPPC